VSATATSTDPARGGPVPEPDPPLVAAREITKSFGATPALRSATLEIATGSTHALVGRNGAGKSTLVAILTGLLEPDSGAVEFGGERAPHAAQRDQWRELVACVYQRSTILPQLTVAENLFINDQPRHGWGLIDWRQVNSAAATLLEEWAVPVDPRTLAGTLTVGQRQLVEIARALRGGTRFIILDEPTAQLEAREIRQLFTHMRALAGLGVTFLYISHHLQEIYDICTDVTVLRDGQVVAAGTVGQLAKDDLVTAMVGDAQPGNANAASIERTRARSTAPSAGESEPARRPVLAVRELAVSGAFADVSFEIGAGERVGVAGLSGCGKSQLGQAVAGALRPDAGAVVINGRAVRLGRVDLAIEAGVGYVPEDRHAAGFAPNLSVEENVTASVTRRFGRLGFIHPERRQQLARRLVEDLQIKVVDTRQLTCDLSGGNQQKAVMARALASDPTVLVLISPTAGVDIASKRALFDIIGRSTAGVLLVSDQLDELALCDRVLVMFEGRIVAELGSGRTDEQLVATMEGM
jgi:simple sugar transport system ATP-binding protein